MNGILVNHNAKKVGMALKYGLFGMGEHSKRYS
jgi:hypothetical protein